MNTNEMYVYYPKMDITFKYVRAGKIYAALPLAFAAICGVAVWGLLTGPSFWAQAGAMALAGVIVASIIDAVCVLLGKGRMVFVGPVQLDELGADTRREFDVVSPGGALVAR